MTIEASLRPRGPYSLALTCRRAHDATRRVDGRTLTAVVDAGDGPELVRASQRGDGTLDLRAESEAGLAQLRFVLACDDDHSEFLRRFAEDPLLREAIRHLKGLRPMRTSTVTQALLRAICGQLIEAKRAFAIERNLIRATTEQLGGLQAPPPPGHLARFAPAQLFRFGLPSRKATALVRICRTLDVERFRDLPGDAAETRLIRERGIGPWSIGVVWTEGLGRYDRGIVGDLGLLKLCSAIRGRWVDADDTAELLAPYEEWAGLACVYLLAGWGRGLVPVQLNGPMVRRARVKARYAA
jgi:3-methyladenine DNA glycosylase/8-oxoguanine DNA glycosylase